jgi:hypothetical protein
MKPRDLAVCLNVSQGQIRRQLCDTNAQRAPYVLVSRYQLEQWAKEMRNAEIYLSEWTRDMPKDNGL